MQVKPILLVMLTACAVACGSTAFAQDYQFSTVYNFTGQADGFQAVGDMSIDGHGNLYAETNGTYDGSAQEGEGAIEEIQAGSHAAQTVVSFPSGTDLPGNPVGPFTFDEAGDLYGLTTFGGPADEGTYFEVPVGKHQATVLASFNGTNGSDPYIGGFTTDSAANLYGITSYGGVGYTGSADTGDGTIFKIATTPNPISPVVQFNNSTGFSPGGMLLSNTAGDMFGTTYAGGTGGHGTIYELKANTTTPIVLYNFTAASAGVGGGVISDGNGNLYGLTGGSYQGKGDGGFGTIYRFNLTTMQFSTLHNFNGTDGSEAGYELYLSPQGNLLGVSSFGGAGGNGTNGGVGTIFEFNLASDVLTTIHSFAGNDGEFPGSALIANAAGNLYGTASHGGNYGEGTIYELQLITPEPTCGALFILVAAIMGARRGRSGASSAGNPEFPG